MAKVMATGTFDILHTGHLYYLQEARKLGGINTTLAVVVATDNTVKKNKKIPIMSQQQRLEIISMLKVVDEAYMGYDGDPLKIVHMIKPDIIAIGPDQDFDTRKLHETLLNEGLDVEVVKIEKYKQSDLDSSCKIIRKIKNTNFSDDYLNDC